MDSNTNNVADGTSGDLDIKLLLSGAPEVGSTVTYVGVGHTGHDVARVSLSALCSSAAELNYTCHGFVGSTECNVLKVVGSDRCCSEAGSSIGDIIDIGCRFSTLDPNDQDPEWKMLFFPSDNPAKFLIKRTTGDFNLQGLETNTTLGNTIETDILPQFCVRVDRGNPAVDGNINFTVEGGPSAGSFTVNSTGKTDQTLHQEITNGFNSLPSGGLTANLLPNAAAKCRFEEDFQGPTVFLPNVHAKQVTSIGVAGVEGQIVSTETSVPGPPIPTLSEWGLIFLAALLGISAFWMLRRRRQNTIAT